MHTSNASHISCFLELELIHPPATTILRNSRQTKGKSRRTTESQQPNFDALHICKEVHHSLQYEIALFVSDFPSVLLKLQCWVDSQYLKGTFKMAAEFRPQRCKGRVSSAPSRKTCGVPSCLRIPRISCCHRSLPVHHHHLRRPSHGRNQSL